MFLLDPEELSFVQLFFLCFTCLLFFVFLCRWVDLYYQNQLF